MIKRDEQEIRERIAYLESMQRTYRRTDNMIGDPMHKINRENYTKSVLRAQIKALKFVLGEDLGYSIAGGDEDT